MEALGSFAVFLTFGSIIVSIALVIAFFIMASNISSMDKKMFRAEVHREEMKASLDKIVKLLQKIQEREKV